MLSERLDGFGAPSGDPAPSRDVTGSLSSIDDKTAALALAFSSTRSHSETSSMITRITTEGSPARSEAERSRTVVNRVGTHPPHLGWWNLSDECPPQNCGRRGVGKDRESRLEEHVRARRAAEHPEAVLAQEGSPLPPTQARNAGGAAQRPSGDHPSEAPRPCGPSREPGPPSHHYRSRDGGHGVLFSRSVHSTASPFPLTRGRSRVVGPRHLRWEHAAPFPGRTPQHPERLDPSPTACGSGGRDAGPAGASSGIVTEIEGTIGTTRGRLRSPLGTGQHR